MFRLMLGLALLVAGVASVPAEGKHLPGRPLDLASLQPTRPEASRLVRLRSERQREEFRREDWGETAPTWERMLGPWSEGEHRFHNRGHLPGMDGIRVRVPQGDSLPEKQLELVMGVIKDDFLVNDDTTGACKQLDASIAMGSSGQFVVAWTDWRNALPDIYAQRYDSSGVPQGANFRVNDNAGWGSQDEPSVAMDGVGGFVVVWADTRSGGGDIYAQRYNSSGVPHGANFAVNDEVGTAALGPPSIAMCERGGFVVAWCDLRNGYEHYDIYAQRCDSSGNPQGANFRVNDDPVHGAAQVVPSVSMDEPGAFVVAWEDYRGDEYGDIYGQRYDSSGAAQGSNFKVNDDIGSTEQLHPSVGMDEAGEFVIAWADERNGDYDVYAQRYDSSGNPQGSNFRVNDDAGSEWQWFPSVSLDSTGGWVVGWFDRRSGDWDVYAQRHDSSGNPQGPNFRVNDDLNTAWHWFPSVATSGPGGFAIAWTVSWAHVGYVGEDIYAQRYDSLGNAQGVNFRVDDDAGSAGQRNPSVAVGENGCSVVAWYDDRHANRDIYAQRYDSSGNPQGPNFRVNDDSGSRTQIEPSVAMAGAGKFVVTWLDWRNSGPDIYAQRYDASGTPQGSNFMVNDELGSGRQWNSTVAMDGAGAFVVAWPDDRNGHDDVYAQRYDSSGVPQGANFRVNDDVGSAEQYWSSVAMCETGGFVVAWSDERNGNQDSDIYAQRFTSSGASHGRNFRVNDDTGLAEQRRPSVAMDRTGAFVVAWNDERNGWEADIYAQRYDSSGNALGSNFRVNDDVGRNYQWTPSVTIDPAGGRFVVFWPDRRYPDGDSEVLAQKYVDGTPSGPNVQINQPDSFPYNHQWSWAFSVASNFDLVAFTWMDNRRHKEWDIYAKLTDWDLVGLEERMPDAGCQMQDARLMQNRPNPFTDATTITYCVQGRDLSTHERINLSIYDLSGRLVKVLVDGSLPTSVVWDGRDETGRPLSSGVYFYRLRAAGSSDTKRMVLLR